MHYNIDFDIALVNYQTRESSNDEESYAKELANRYFKKCYTLKSPRINSNFEKQARDIRYKFFDKLMQDYDNLIMGHQLNDQLEWMFMRLSKGAGVMELIGLEAISTRKDYQIIRPLLKTSKDELIEFLESNNYRYFVDSSNFSDKYERNRFREEFANSFIEKYRDGVVRSFDYLKIDKAQLLENFREIYRYRELIILRVENMKYKIKAIDITLKKLGYLLSNAQRNEIIKSNSIVVGGLWVIETQENLIFIAPYLKINMPKEYKELCRLEKIPSKIRPYCYKYSILLNQIRGKKC
ncbi:tRNA(Ile)-lysidine synthetase [hydrothermal vent metagenome]|uniref:tRNA(Ile)-lysidine synthetase n=1 Tax=hydrothermal vent metagenome TaxID=652676 RepID=A0A1W1ELL8_9ZZZZ